MINNINEIVNTTNNDISNKPKTVVFALPGKSYSREFLLSWSSLLFECTKRNIQPIISQNYSSCVHFARSKVFGANVLKGADQKPFQGELDYDYIMCIDSDIIFHFEDFFKLLESPYDVTSGLYLMQDATHFPLVKEWNEDYFEENGTFPFLTPEEVKKYPKVNNKYIDCVYNGMGFMLIKKGVIEKLKYPWFYHEVIKMGNNIQEMCSEDVAFCKNLSRENIKIMVDTSCRVGHEKLFII